MVKNIKGPLRNRVSELRDKVPPSLPKFHLTSIILSQHGCVKNESLQQWTAKNLFQAGRGVKKNVGYRDKSQMRPIRYSIVYVVT